MKKSRRRMFQTLAASAAFTAQAQEPSPGIEELRLVANAHGVSLSDERLRLLRPVLERRKATLQALRDFAIDDSVSPL